MQSFSAWARRIATGILVVVGVTFTGVVFPVVSHFIQEQPQESLKSLHVVLKFLLDLSEQTWLRVTALLLSGFVAQVCGWTGFCGNWTAPVLMRERTLDMK